MELALGSFSASVADAIEYCNKDNIPQFYGSEALVSHCRQMNDMFDLLNSRIFLKEVVTETRFNHNPNINQKYILKLSN